VNAPPNPPTGTAGIPAGAHPVATSSPITVSVVEDDPGYRNLLSILLDRSPGFRLRAAHPDVPGLLSEIKSDRPQVILMDLELPGPSGVEGVRQALAAAPQALVIILTAFDDHEKVFQSLRAGAVGYLLKSSSLVEILDAIQDAVNGGSPMSGPIARMVVRSLQPQPANSTSDPLSGRERELLDLLAEGLRYKEAAGRMGISINTVRTYIRRAYEKLQAQSRMEAVRTLQRGA
jgi:DNA-binding NarL/FixJ family response regulator